MKGNLLVSLLKFIIIFYLIIILFEIVFPYLIVGSLIFLAYKAYTKRIKKDNQEEETKIIKENQSNETKKDEYKNYIINELYILSEKCNSLDYDKKTEYLKRIKETLDEFTSRYDKMIDNSYENCLVLDTEEKIKMDFIERIVKLEEEINIELDKNSKKRDIHKESNKLQNSIGKKLNGYSSFGY